jgi:hypothetical protein
MGLIITYMRPDFGYGKTSFLYISSGAVKAFKMTIITSSFSYHSFLLNCNNINPNLYGYMVGGQ